MFKRKLVPVFKVSILALVVALLLCSCAMIGANKTVSLNHLVFVSSVEEGDKLEKVIEPKINHYLENKQANYRINFIPYGDFRFKTESDAVVNSSKFDRTNLAWEHLKELNPDIDLISISNGLDVGRYLGTSAYKNLVDKSVLLPLDDFVSRKAPDLPPTIPQYLIDACRVEHKLYGLRMDLFAFSFRTLSINKAYVEQYKDKIPQLKSDVFACKEFLQGLQAQGIQPLLATHENPYMLFMPYSKCRALVYTQDKGFACYYDLPETEQYLNKMAEWHAEGLVYATDSPEMQAQDVFAAFDFGQTLHELDAMLYFKKNGAPASVKSRVYPLQEFALVSDTSNDLVTSVAKDSQHTAEACDYLWSLFTDKDLVAALSAEDEAFFALKPYVNPKFIPQYEQSVLSNVDQAYLDRVYELSKASDLYGFRFDTVPVQEELQRCNMIIGAWEQGKGPCAEAKAVMDFAQPMPENLEKLRALFREAGMDKIVAEAQRQLDVWRASKVKR